jgi:hypothetical protein
MPTRAVDSAVEKVCRHAGKVVRSLGTALWIGLCLNEVGLI